MCVCVCGISRVSLKFCTKYLNHTLKDIFWYNIEIRQIKSIYKMSLVCLRCDIYHSTYHHGTLPMPLLHNYIQMKATSLEIGCLGITYWQLAFKELCRPWITVPSDQHLGVLFHHSTDCSKAKSCQQQRHYQNSALTPIGVRNPPVTRGSNHFWKASWSYIWSHSFHAFSRLRL